MCNCVLKIKTLFRFIIYTEQPAQLMSSGKKVQSHNNIIIIIVISVGPLLLKKVIAILILLVTVKCKGNALQL